MVSRETRLLTWILASKIPPSVDKKGLKACVSKRFGADAVKMFKFEIQGAGGASKMIAGSILQSLVRTGGRDEGVQTECRVKDSILCQNQTLSQADTLVPVDSFGSIQANQSFPRTLIINVYQTWVSLCPLSLNLS